METKCYSINYTICDKSCFRETFRSLKKRLYEHQQELLKNDTNYTSVVHSNKEGYHLNLKGAKFIKHIYNKQKKSIIEFAIILKSYRIEQRSSKVELAPFLATKIIAENGIVILYKQNA